MTAGRVENREGGDEDEDAGKGEAFCISWGEGGSPGLGWWYRKEWN